MVPDEGVCFLLQAPAQHVTEAMNRISLVDAQVNALFWSTQWSTHVHITLLLNKNRVVVSLHMRSIIRAQKLASALSDRLDRYFESLRLERFHSQELGLKFDTNMVTDSDEPEVTITDALDLYVRLKGTGRGKVFARTAERNVGYLIECIGETSLSDIKPTDAGSFVTI